MSKTKTTELEAALKSLREQKKRLQEEKKKEQEEKKRLREEKKQQKLELQLKKMDENGRVDRQKERVILCVEARPCLWDKSCSDYKDRYAKEVAWTGVARELDLAAEKVKTMWNNLTDQAREIWRNEVYHSGDGINDKIEESKTWKFYRSMEFYRKVYKFRKTDSNFNVTGSENLSDSEGEIADDSPFEFEDSSTDFRDDVEDETAGDKSQHLDEESQSTSSYTINNDGSNSQGESSQPSACDENSQVQSPQASSSGSSKKSNEKSKIKSNSSRKSTVQPKPKDRKRKYDEMDEKLLSHMELAAKVLTESEDPTEKFLSYLGENLRTVPEQKRKKCEQKIMQLVYSYNDDECEA